MIAALCVTAPPLWSVTSPALAVSPAMAGWKPSAVAPTLPMVKPIVSVKARLPAVVCPASAVTLLVGCVSVMPVPADRPTVLAVTLPAVWVIAPVVVNRNAPVPSVRLLPTAMPPEPLRTPRFWFPLT